MSGVPCYAFMTEKDFNEAMKSGETCKDFTPDAYTIADQDDFSHYSDYVKSTEEHEAEDKRIEAAKEVAHYLGDFVHVDEHGVLEIPVDGKLKFAAEKLKYIKKLIADMTPEEYAGIGEYSLRQTVRNEGIFAFPLDYEENDNMPVGCYLQPMDAFMHNLPHLKEPLRLVVVQTAWLHQ